MTGWLRVKGAAEYCSISERTFRDWLRQGLKFSRLPSGTILIRISDLDSFLESFAVDENQQAERIDRIVSEVEPAEEV